MVLVTSAVALLHRFSPHLSLTSWHSALGSRKTFFGLFSCNIKTVGGTFLLQRTIKQQVIRSQLTAAVKQCINSGYLLAWLQSVLPSCKWPSSTTKHMVMFSLEVAKVGVWGRQSWQSREDLYSEESPGTQDFYHLNFLTTLWQWGSLEYWSKVYRAVLVIKLKLWKSGCLKAWFGAHFQVPVNQIERDWNSICIWNLAFTQLTKVSKECDKVHVTKSIKCTTFNEDSTPPVMILTFIGLKRSWLLSLPLCFMSAGLRHRSVVLYLSLTLLLCASNYLSSMIP